MTFEDGFKVFLGIIAGLGLLLVCFFAGYAAFDVVGDPAIYANMIVPFLAGVGVWVRRKNHPSPFLNGLLIGICLTFLLCTTCDVLVENIKW